MQLIRKTLILAVLLSLSLTAIPATSLAAEATWRFDKRGFGHGIGMSQYGANGMAANGSTAQQIISTYFTGATLASSYNGRVATPIMNVAVTTARNSVWTVNAPLNDLMLVHSGGTARLTKGVTYVLDFTNYLSTYTVHVKIAGQDGASVGYFGIPMQGITVYADYGTDANYALGAGNGREHVVALGELSGPFGRNFIAYKGELNFYNGGKDTDGVYRNNVRNRLYIEPYLEGVVPREMGASWNIEALKAQAIIARSYAARNGFAGKNLLTAPESNVVACTDAFQVYNGWGQIVSGVYARHSTDAQYSSKIASAVWDTWGRVAVHSGSIIEGYFSAAAGGHTENSENVWVATLPYLKGVPEPYRNDTVCDESKTFTASQIVAVANKVWGSTIVPADTKLTSIRVTKTGVSPRPMEITITSSNYGTRILGGNSKMQSFLRHSDWGWKYSSNYVTITQAVTPDPVPSVPIERIAGADRAATSVAASKKAFPTGTLSEVIIAGGEVDALAASGMAGVLNGGSGGPVLVTYPNSLAPSVRDEIVRLKVKTVYIVGGTGAVSKAVEDALKAIPGVTVYPRYAGADRFETAQKINEGMKNLGGTLVGSRAVVIDGMNPVEAAGASALAFANRVPILLVQPKAIPAPTAKTIADLGINKTYILGGTGAVSDQVRDALPNAERVAAGASRYETATLFAQWLVANEGFSYKNIFVSSGESLVDGLSASAAAGKTKSPIVLCPNKSTDPALSALLTAQKAAVERVYILGGTGVISQTSESQIGQCFTP